MQKGILFYKFIPIVDPTTVMYWQRALCEKLGLKGKSKREDWVTQAKELVAGKAPRAKIDQKAAEAAAKV